MIIYGKYRKLRNAAWQCLIDYHISSLPVDPLEIARTSGIKVIQNCDVDVLTGDESGVCIVDGEQYYIVYDDECSEPRRRFIIAHELGHIFLGHSMFAGRIARGHGGDKSRTELEADMFAYRVLAPACVLWGLGVSTADEIAEICGITQTAAKNRADRMKVLLKRDKFLTSPMEKQVYSQFGRYIQQNKKMPGI